MKAFGLDAWFIHGFWMEPMSMCVCVHVMIARTAQPTTEATRLVKREAVHVTRQ